MNIGLDWDHTFTRDTRSWEKFITMMTLAGHKIWIVTARGPDTPVEYVPENIEGVVYCEYVAKKVVTRNMGVSIDVWIDDDPQWIEKGFVEGDQDGVKPMLFFGPND